jgi:hypothetical protein
MRKLIVLSVLALAIPAAALASDPTPGTPSQNQAAQASCRTQRATLGTALFNQTYVGTTNANRANAFGKCISSAVRSEQANTAAANVSCKAALLADKAAFKAKYSSFGKCVSFTVAAANQARQAAVIAAAKSCKADKTASASTFASLYGTGANAFGKCVSFTVAAANQARQAAVIAAAKSCKADKTASASTFASLYGTGANAFGKCVAAKTHATP